MEPNGNPEGAKEKPKSAQRTYFSDMTCSDNSDNLDNSENNIIYKYTLDGFSNLAKSAGFKTIQSWTDPNKYFSVHYLLAD